METSVAKIKVREKAINGPSARINNQTIVVTGKWIRMAAVHDEHWIEGEVVEDPEVFMSGLKNENLKADIFTFVQKLPDTKPRYKYHMELDKLAVLPITTYENWWKKQINDKTRNMVRRAQKSGVEVRVTEFTDELVRGIAEIYNESPLRQGRPFKHYGKDFETLKRDHISYLERSDFIGAFFRDELIGFVKLVHSKGFSNLMQIISKVAHREKAPTNALIAKAVEICAQRGVPYLNYGVWSRRGLGDFKKHHAFEKFDKPRYYVPLNLKGKLALKFGLHQKIAEHLPGSWVDFLVDIKIKWYTLKYYSSKV